MIHDIASNAELTGNDAERLVLDRNAKARRTPWKERFSMTLAVIVLSVLVSTTIASSANATVVRPRYDQIEWTWLARPDHESPRLPNVFIVGDSIARGYHDKVAKILDGRANLYLFATSASVGDPRLTKQILDCAALLRRRFTVIHFNNGLHGVMFDVEDYRRGFPKLVSVLHRISPNARLIWATTTPVIETSGDHLSNTEIDQRNAVALKLVTRLGLGLDDLHTLMVGRDGLHSDTVHYSSAGSILQATQVATVITRSLESRGPLRL